MRVAVVTVTFNAERFVPDLLSSLGKLNAEGLEVDLIMVDNLSTDRTVALLEQGRSALPNLRVMPQQENLGFTGGNDVGYRAAVAAGAVYVYLLNPDTVVEPDFLLEAVRVAEADPKAGSVQSLILLHPDTHLVNSTGNAIHFLGLGYAAGYRAPADAARKGSVHEIAYASGAGVLLRVAAVAEVGLFDETFFMYHEDLDLGWRLRLAGWKNLIAPRSVVYHKYEFSRSIKKYYWMERNRWAVLFKNCGAWTLLVLAPWLILSELALFAISIVRGWWREKLRVYAAFFDFEFWFHLAEERSKVALFRRVPDRKIFALYTPVIAFQDVEPAFTQYVANPLMTALWAVLRLLIV